MEKTRFSRWVAHVKRAGQPGESLAVRLGLIVVLLGFVASLYLAQASQMSTLGRRLEALRAEYEQLRRENAELLYQISQDASIPRLEQRAAELGFVPAEKIEFLPITVTLSVAPAAPFSRGSHVGQVSIPAVSRGRGE